MLFEDAAHLRLQSLLSFSYNKDATSPQSGFDARAHFGKEGRILHIHDAAGEHHIETPLQPLAGEPAFEVVVARNQVAEKTLLVHDAGIVVPEHRQRLEAGSHKRIAEPAVNHAPSPSFLFSSRRRHTRLVSDWSSDVCSSDLIVISSRRRHTRLVSDWSSDVCSSD